MQQESLKSWNKSEPIKQKEPLWHTKTKAKAGNTLGERNTMRQYREESKSKTKDVARDKPHGRKKKYKTKKQREEIKAAEEKKKKGDFNVNVSNVNVKVEAISFNERG